MNQDQIDLDDHLVVRHLSPRKSNETLREAVDRILNWEVMVNLDHAVSSAAVALVAQGKLEERKRIVEALRAKHETAKHIHNYYACLAREIEEGEL